MRKTSRSRTICAAIVALAAVAAVPAAADAKGAAVHQTTFKATLSGSQVTTWEYHHKSTGGCDSNSDGYGDQSISFGAKRTFRVTFYKPPKGQPDLFGTNGRPAPLVNPAPRLAAKATRHADVSQGGADQSTCPGDNGGADPGYVPPPPDCGVRTGSFAARLYFHDNSTSNDDLFVPLPWPDEKNHLRLEGMDYRWNKPGGSSTSELRDTYERCQLIAADDLVDTLGHIYVSPAKLSEKQLFDRKRKKIVVSGDNTAKRSSADGSAKTILAWNLRLTRVK